MDFELPKCTSLSIHTDIGVIEINSDGTVEYPDDLPHSAKAFWDAVIGAFPDVRWGEQAVKENHE